MLSALITSIVHGAVFGRKLHPNRIHPTLFYTPSVSCVHYGDSSYNYDHAEQFIVYDYNQPHIQLSMPFRTDYVSPQKIHEAPCMRNRDSTS